MTTMLARQADSVPLSVVEQAGEFSVRVLRHDADGFEAVCQAGNVVIRTAHSGPLSSRVWVHMPGWGEPVGLHHMGLLALALHFSGADLAAVHRAETTAASLVGLAESVARGVERAGAASLVRLDKAERALSRREGTGPLAVAERRGRVWNHRRRQLCTDLAYRLLFAAEGGLPTAKRRIAGLA